MATMYENMVKLDNLARRLHIMESRMRSGQWIDAWRDLGGIISDIEREKKLLVKGNENGQ